MFSKTYWDFVWFSYKFHNAMLVMMRITKRLFYSNMSLSLSFNSMYIKMTLLSTPDLTTSAPNYGV